MAGSAPEASPSVQPGPQADRPGLTTWPLPALLTWAAAWLLFRAALDVGLPAGAAALAAVLLGLLAAMRQRTGWRRLMTAAGFPLSFVMGGAGVTAGLTGLAALWWLAPAALLLLLYPPRSWSDAPLFPTPADALAELPRHLALRPRPRLLDAGCGLGHGLAALRRAWPDAELHGIEWSPLVALAARWRCPWARVARGDMWATDWRDHDLVYLFQRPASMPRAWDKACAELQPGRWLASLEFPVPGVEPSLRLDGAAGKPVWLYQIGRR